MRRVLTALAEVLGLACFIAGMLVLGIAADTPTPREKPAKHTARVPQVGAFYMPAGR